MLEELRPVGREPGVLLTRLNRDLTRILRQTGQMIFVTAAYAVIDLAAGQLRYGQAGHPAPLRWRRPENKIRRIGCTAEQAGPAIGLMHDFEFATCVEAWAPGDRLFLFTDGLSEVASPAGEEFGEARLIAALGRRADEPLEVCLAGVIEEAGIFGHHHFADDVCVVAADCSEG